MVRGAIPTSSTYSARLLARDRLLLLDGCAVETGAPLRREWCSFDRASFEWCRDGEITRPLLVGAGGCGLTMEGFSSKCEHISSRKLFVERFQIHALKTMTYESTSGDPPRFRNFTRTSHAFLSGETLLFGSTQVCCEREYGKGGVCGLACRPQFDAWGISWG